MIFVTVHSCGGSMAEAIVPREVFGPFSSITDTQTIKSNLYTELGDILPDHVWENLFINIIDIPASGNYNYQAYIDEMKLLWEGDD